MDLIYDRILEDANEVRQMLAQIQAQGGLWALSEEEQRQYFLWHPKGAYNARDLNRVESNTQLLHTRLRQAGYGYAITIKVNWTNEDNLRQGDMDRIRANVDYLQTYLTILPQWRAILYNSTMDFEQANTLEWNLYLIDLWLERMVAAMFFSDELYAGEV